MSIRFQADNDLDQTYVVALRRLERAIDFQTASAARLHGLDDYAVLMRAASEERILVTSDKRTMARALDRFISDGGTSPGVLIVIPQNAPIRGVIETLLHIWAASLPREWVNQAHIIPF